MGRAVHLHGGEPDLSQHEAAGPPLGGLGGHVNGRRLPINHSESFLL